MRQFDVVANPSPATRGYAPYLALLQSHHFEVLDSVVMAPLVRDAARPVTPVDISVVVGGEALTLAVAEMAAVSRRPLGNVVASLRDYEDRIRRVLDRIFVGF